MKNPSLLYKLLPIEKAQEILANFPHQGNSPVDGGVADVPAAQVFITRLVRDVERCADCDMMYGPASDAARHTAGDEYEVKLCEDLDAAGIAYFTEKDLRDTGHIKTPDARLLVPIAMQGRVISWIESKATFGDEKQHAKYSAEQYEKYCNRYGSGMVIYWHGYLAHLQKSEENVLLADCFPAPENITTLPRLPLSLANGGESGSEKPVLQAVGVELKPSAEKKVGKHESVGLAIEMNSIDLNVDDGKPD